MQEVNISESNFEQCLKCNLCTMVCPMMAVNPSYPGPKQAGPDGERYRLKDPAFYDLTLKFCLNCKRCEVACPSGVKVGDIIQRARLKYGTQSHPIRDFALANTDLVGSVSSPLAPVVNPVLSLGAVKSVMHSVLGVDKHRTFPSYSSRKFTTWYRKEALPLQSRYPRFVTFFHGCYVNYNFPQLGRDLLKIMNACQYGVRLMDGEKCCGVALISNGFSARAKRQASANVSAIRKALEVSDAVVTCGSTCTFTIRDEYDHVLGIQSSDIRDSVMLASKFLYEKLEGGEIKLAFRQDYHKKIVYHTACHMQKLGWSVYSIALLRMIPGVTLDVPEQHCCGIAGTFGFKKENYPYSQEIGSQLFESLRTMNPEVVATECETCKWQIEMSTDFKVFNPVSILAEALDVEKTIVLNKKL